MNHDNEDWDTWHKKKEDLQFSWMINWQKDQNSQQKMSLFDQSQQKQWNSKIQSLLSDSEISSTKRNQL